jgi:hypothetical protein
MSCREYTIIGWYEWIDGLDLDEHGRVAKRYDMIWYDMIGTCYKKSIHSG